MGGIKFIDKGRISAEEINCLWWRAYLHAYESGVDSMSFTRKSNQVERVTDVEFVRDADLRPAVIVAVLNSSSENLNFAESPLSVAPPVSVN